MRLLFVQLGRIRAAFVGNRGSRNFFFLVVLSPGVFIENAILGSLVTGIPIAGAKINIL